MAHRFVDTGKWSEDWYCELKGEYQKLWDYICDHCDNAGIWKPNKIDFEIKTGFKVSLDSFFKKVNGDKLRIASLANGRWFLPGFIQYQWFTKKQSFNLVLTNPRHKHIFDLLEANGIKREMVRGLEEVWKTSMAMANKEAKVLEKGAGENLLPNGLIFDAEAEVLANQIEFERICMKCYKPPDIGKSVLHKYHLHMQEKDQYPVKRKTVFAGFEKWLLNEKNVTHQQTPAPKTGTSEARTDALKGWGLSGGKQVP